MFGKIGKKLSGIKDKINMKILLLAAPALSFATTPNDFGKLGFGNNATSESWIKDLLTQKYIAIPIKIVIIMGIMFAVFNIAKGLLGGQGQGSDLWKNIGAIIALGILYFVLFFKLAS